MTAPRRPPAQTCTAHGPYRAWRPVCPDCLREQQRLENESRRQELVDRLEPRRPVPYNEFPPGY